MRGSDGQFSPPTLEQMAVVNISIGYEHLLPGVRLKTRKHGIACGDIVVEEMQRA